MRTAVALFEEFKGLQVRSFIRRYRGWVLENFTHVVNIIAQ